MVIEWQFFSSNNYKNCPEAGGFGPMTSDNRGLRSASKTPVRDPPGMPLSYSICRKALYHAPLPPPFCLSLLQCLIKLTQKFRFSRPIFSNLSFEICATVSFVLSDLKTSLDKDFFYLSGLKCTQNCLKYEIWEQLFFCLTLTRDANPIDFYSSSSPSSLI